MVAFVGRLHVNADWYDYATKSAGRTSIEAPADLPEEVAAEVQRVALLAFNMQVHRMDRIRLLHHHRR